MKYARRKINSAQLWYQSPCFCPHCGVAVEFRIVSVLDYDDYRVHIYSCVNPDCNKLSLVAYYRIESDYLAICMHPAEKPADLPGELTQFERFNTLYLQALRAEQNSDFDLAACGYRNAVEALVKDYAVKYKGVASDTKLMHMTLDKCIETYLDGLDEIVSAYIVKQLGNSATHYPPCGVEFDFPEQKEFLDVFLSYMTSKIKILAASERIPRRFLPES